MYEIVHTKAIIFLDRKEKEYDKVFFIFSEELGLLSVKTPGILKPGAKLNSLIQPFRIVSGDIIVGKTTKKMISVIETESFESLFTDFRKKESILKLFEFIVLLVPRNTEVRELYCLFETYIKKLKLIVDNDYEILVLETKTLHAILVFLGYGNTVPASVEIDPFVLHPLLLHRVQQILKEINT